MLVLWRAQVATLGRVLGVLPPRLRRVRGNVQISHGARHVTHKSCLKKTDGGFKMIKFVE